MSDHREIRALSLYQPWAQAISLGLKRYETRSWATRYRGPLLIHASKRSTAREKAFWLDSIHELFVLGADAGLIQTYSGIDSQGWAQEPPLGCIVAIADLVECRSTSEGSQLGLTELERLFGDFSPARYVWQLANVIRLPEPVPCKGARGLWEPPAEVLDAVASLAKSS